MKGYLKFLLLNIAKVADFVSMLQMLGLAKTLSRKVFCGCLEMGVVDFLSTQRGLRCKAFFVSVLISHCMLSLKVFLCVLATLRALNIERKGLICALKLPLPPSLSIGILHIHSRQ
jgi:hypothetical protein